MRYVALKPQYKLRGWRDQKFAIYNTAATGWDTDRVIPLSEVQFDAVQIATAGGVDIDHPFLLPAMRRAAEKLLDLGIFEEAGAAAKLASDQEYRYADTRRVDCLHWEITGRCNLRCRHCYYAAGENPGSEPDLERCREIVRQLVAANVYAVDLTGGEPFVRRDFWELMALLQENGIRVDQIFTNGTLVTEKVMDRLEENKQRPDCFLVSFDGVGCHDWMRGLLGTEEKTVRALRLMKEYNYPIVVTTVVHDESLSCLSATYELLKKLDIGLWRVAPVINTGSWKRNARPVADNEKFFAAALELIKLWRADGRLFRLRLGSFFEGYPDGSWNIPSLSGSGTNDWKQVKLCEFAHSFPHLLPDGRLLPCLVMSDTPLADLAPDIFAPGMDISRALLDTKIEGWNISTYADLFEHNAECADCEFRLRCTHCPAEAIVESDDWYGHISSSCLIAKGGWEEKIASLLR